MWKLPGSIVQPICSWYLSLSGDHPVWIHHNFYQSRNINILHYVIQLRDTGYDTTNAVGLVFSSFGIKVEQVDGAAAHNDGLHVST